jgi:hypothetical protein
MTRTEATQKAQKLASAFGEPMSVLRNRPLGFGVYANARLSELGIPASDVVQTIHPLEDKAAE